MIEVEDHGPVALVRLAHGKVNALDLELAAAIRDTFRQLPARGCGAVVLTGAGTTFCAGVDLRQVVEGGAAYLQAFLPVLGGAFDALFNVGLPVVAAVNGHALAGGFVLVSACDVRLVADGPARLGVPELLAGVPFPSLALEIVRYAVGPRATHLVLTGAAHRPAPALAQGLVDEVVPPAELEAVALGAARTLAEQVPPATYRLAKRQLRAEANAAAERGRQVFEAEVAALWEAEATVAWVDRYLGAVTGR